ncbi:hypothetical protein [Dictyobacter formicarum]|uniref:hypothetical protein n=1 Tax=Dictyobacter formicarum TaxID=2778368 RepID=UPI001914FC97|nr:hypothetical protein [Dictyobacter formicarum]
MSSSASLPHGPLEAGCQALLTLFDPDNGSNRERRNTNAHADLAENGGWQDDSNIVSARSTSE